MTLEQAIATLEEGRIIERRPGYPLTVDERQRDFSRCGTGERYEIVVSGGIKEEGQCFPASFDTPEEAVQAWLDAALSFAGDAKQIYWRGPPELGPLGHQFVVYARFQVAP